jgi:hypothetical protein
MSITQAILIAILCGFAGFGIASTLDAVFMPPRYDRGRLMLAGAICWAGALALIAIRVFKLV